MQASAKPASQFNPGIPPSSLMSLLRAAPAISGAVIADFDSAFVNRSAVYLLCISVVWIDPNAYPGCEPSPERMCGLTFRMSGRLAGMGGGFARLVPTLLGNSSYWRFAKLHSN